MHILHILEKNNMSLKNNYLTISKSAYSLLLSLTLQELEAVEYDNPLENVM